MTQPNPYAAFQNQANAQPTTTQAAPVAAYPPPPPAYAPPAQPQYAAPPPAYPTPAAPPPQAYAPAPQQPAYPQAPSYGQPQPAYGATGAVPRQSIQTAQPGGGLNLFPNSVIPGTTIRAIVRVESYVGGRVSPSRGAYGGPQNVAGLTVVHSSAPDQLPVGARYDKAWRCGFQPNADRDLWENRTFAAAYYGIAANEPNPPHRAQLVPPPGFPSTPWDGVLADLEQERFDVQPKYLEIVLTDNGRPVLDKNTKQPNGRHYARSTWLPAPAPGAQG